MDRGKISFNHNANGSISVKIELSGGTVWVTKSEIANLLEVFPQQFLQIFVRFSKVMSYLKQKLPAIITALSSTT